MCRNLSYLLFVVFILAALSSPAAAQTACPDVSGTWSSEGSLAEYCSVNSGVPTAGLSSRTCTWNFEPQPSDICSFTAKRECDTTDSAGNPTKLVTYFTGVIYNYGTKIAMQIVPTDPPSMSYNPPGTLLGEISKVDKKANRVTEINYISNAGDQYTKSNGDGTSSSYSCAWSGKGRIYR
jgi:hypothetical protein